jgi:hypothetical protein
MRPPELEKDPGDVAQTARMAIDPDRLRRVLRMAGADEVAQTAAEALRGVAADALSRRLSRAAAAVRLPAAGLDSNTLEEARAAIRRAYVELAIHQSGSPRPAEAVQQELAVEIATLAGHAVVFARSQGRAVDAACVAAAASRRGAPGWGAWVSAP